MLGKMWERYLNEEGRSRVREVDIDAIRINKPTLVVLPGFFTTHKNQRSLSGNIKIMNELLAKQNPQVYCWSHPGLHNVFNLAAYNSLPSVRHSRSGDHIAKGIILPLVTGADGQPLPADDAKRNLRNLTLFGYSAGTILAQEIYNAARALMKKAGFEKEEAKDILNEVVLVAVGAVSSFGKEKNRFTTLYLVATNDKLMRAKNWIWGTFGTALRTLFTRYGLRSKNEPLKIRDISETSVFISAPIQAQFYEHQKNADGTVEKKEIRPLFPTWTFLHSYHEMPHYMTRDDNNNDFAHIGHYALINAVSRDKRLTTQDLLKSPKAAPEYDAKIANARLAA